MLTKSDSQEQLSFWFWMQIVLGINQQKQDYIYKPPKHKISWTTITFSRFVYLPQPQFRNSLNLAIILNDLTYDVGHLVHRSKNIIVNSNQRNLVYLACLFILIRSFIFTHSLVFIYFMRVVSLASCGVGQRKWDEISYNN